MNILVVVTNYPNAGHPYSGAFNERSARALKTLGHEVEVLAPRPYIPGPLAALHPRWRAYKQISARESRGGLSVYRPAYLQVPGLGGWVRPDLGAYISCGHVISERHRNRPYDAILAFNLIGAGGLAWRLAHRLDIPAAGWATGNDVRVPSRSAHGRAVRTALQRLDLVFYQSCELLDRAAALCSLPREVFAPRRHIVLPRGVDPAPVRSGDARRAMRAQLDVGEDQLLLLFVGRIVRAKGVFELVEAFEQVRRERPEIVCVLVGAHDGFDDSAELRAKLERTPELARGLRLLPACPPEMVWEYLHAGDMFVFPSHSEGMPNSLLEAMAAGLPALAGEIPAVREIDDGAGVLEIVPTRDAPALARGLIALASSPVRRKHLSEKGKARVLDHYQAKTNMAEAMRRLNNTVVKSGTDAISLRAPEPITKVRPT
jgi:teichuronic acid biosynthesis glycosyltransferase TuaC